MLAIVIGIVLGIIIGLVLLGLVYVLRKSYVFQFIPQKLSAPCTPC